MTSLAVDRDRTTVNGTGIGLPASASGVVTVSFDGRYVWAFQPRRDAIRRDGHLLVEWPAALKPHLHGSTQLTVSDHQGGQVHLDEEVTLGRPGGRIRVEDPQGHPLAVNKVGHLTRVFAETSDSTRREILEGTARVLEDLRVCGGVPAFLNYGCLLGAIREGRMIGTDCDADLCYLSDHTDPVDVIVESFRLERTMLARGWRTVRMSGGDFKVLLELADGRLCHIDVFVGFYVDDVYYQLGNRSGSLPRESITPTSTVLLEGVELPAPADPEAMLSFVYGPSWRVPDPAFKFADPPGGVRRLDGWLRGQRDELPRWNDFFRSSRAALVPAEPSSFARWVQQQISTGEAIAELGCGLGRDAGYFADEGHPVLAYDVSPDARRATQKRLRPYRSRATVRRLMLAELRTVAVTGLEIALNQGRTHVYARHLVGCVDAWARRNVWRLARTALSSNGGCLFLEFSAAGAGLPRLSPGTEPAQVARIDADEVVRELAEYGGRVLRRTDGPGTDMFDDPDPSTCRLQVTFTSTSPGTSRSPGEPH